MYYDIILLCVMYVYIYIYIYMYNAMVRQADLAAVQILEGHVDLKCQMMFIE